jgi:hypothetical protein
VPGLKNQSWQQNKLLLLGFLLGLPRFSLAKKHTL